MIIISSVYATAIIKKQIQTLGSETVKTAVANINVILTNAETTLNDICFSVQNVISQGGTQDDVKNQMVDFTDWLIQTDARFENFSGVYGYIRGQYIDGSDWIPDSDYVPTERPWYKGALLENGETAYSDPYIDAQTGQVVITISKNITDENDAFLGVAAFDIDIGKISDYVSQLKLGNNGYGILISNTFMVISHTNDAFQLTYLEDIPSFPIVLTDALKNSKEISALQFTDYNGLKSVAFFSEIFHGWMIGIVSPVQDYYAVLDNMLWVLSIYGFALMCVMSGLLLFLAFKNQEHLIKIATDTAKIEHYKNLIDKDALTGIRNRHSYEELSKAYRDKLESFSSFGIGVLDINNLKYVNDNLGHNFGDAYIKNSSEFICKCFSNSPVFRIGGDEFVALFINVSEERVLDSHSLLVDTIDEFNKNNNFKAGIAFGYSFYDKEVPKTFDEIFKQADENMYNKKRESKKLH